jgi:cysteinyl-tRNA synthetase
MLEFSFEALEESAVAYRRIEKFLKRAGKQEPIIDSKFADLMNDDLAVPQALALVSEWLSQGNTALTLGKSADVASAAAKIRGVLTVLGCDPFDAAFAASENSELTQAIDGLISLLLEQREAARSRKDFAAADAIRDRISGMGITVEDTPEGPRWSL